MTNPFDLDYILAASAALGPFAWTFLFLQAAGVGVGLYLRFIRSDRNTTRKLLLDRLGLLLIFMGGVGILLGVLRANAIAVFDRRYWFYLLLLVELGLAGYVVYYARTIYPRRLAEKLPSRSRSSPHRSVTSVTSPRKPTSSANGLKHPPAPPVTSSSSRREARQRRKRKQR